MAIFKNNETGDTTRIPEPRVAYEGECSCGASKKLEGTAQGAWLTAQGWEKTAHRRGDGIEHKTSGEWFTADGEPIGSPLEYRGEVLLAQLPPGMRIVG